MTSRIQPGRSAAEAHALATGQGVPWDAMTDAQRRAWLAASVAAIAELLPTGDPAPVLRAEVEALRAERDEARARLDRVRDVVRP